MDTKNFLLASLAGGIVFFVSGFLFYGVLLSDFMVAGSAEGVMKETPDFVPLILSQLIFGAFLTMVLRRWPGAGTLAQGAKAGASLGVMLGLGFSLVQYATMNVMTAPLIPVEAVGGLSEAPWQAEPSAPCSAAAKNRSRGLHGIEGFQPRNL